MFKRYTEKARRVIFFAHREATQFGAAAIQTEHLLLGLLKENNDLVKGFARNWPSMERIREDITKRPSVEGKQQTSDKPTLGRAGGSVSGITGGPATSDLPLSNECKRILAYAASEAERLHHHYISTEHLLLGMLRETNCLAAEILQAQGINLDATRDKIALAPMPEIAKIRPLRNP